MMGGSAQAWHRPLKMCPIMRQNHLKSFGVQVKGFSPWELGKKSPQTKPSIHFGTLSRSLGTVPCRMSLLKKTCMCSGCIMIALQLSSLTCLDVC